MDKRSDLHPRDSGQYVPGSTGTGKSHLAAALGHAMVDAGYRVLFTRTTDLVQQLQAARQELRLATAIEKLDNTTCLSLTIFPMSGRARLKPA
jgi:DNA replication protein DnaC